MAQVFVYFLFVYSYEINKQNQFCCFGIVYVLTILVGFSDLTTVVFASG